MYRTVKVYAVQNDNILFGDNQGLKLILSLAYGSACIYPNKALLQFSKAAGLVPPYPPNEM